MLHPSWKTILFLSFVAVLLCDALMACFASSYYKKRPIGKLNPSQLRVKQGNATKEQRLNVFVVSFLFGIVNLRNIIFAIILAAVVNFAYMFLT